jgi:glucose/mannose-6-phosphate isomerase
VSALSREAIAAVDRRGMLGDVLEQPGQLMDALWRVESAAIPRRDAPGGLLVCGMGGSAIGGDLARAALGERARRPIRTVRDYAPEPWLDATTLVLCSSYSGDTEETLACYRAAGEAGAARVVLTTGGALADAARADGVPVIGIPSGMQPRAAVAYMVVGALECAVICGAAPSLREEIESATGRLAALAGEWGPDGPEDGEAKTLARSLLGVLPLVYGVGLSTPPARRWKAQINENANLPAFYSELPEADHNEICGFEAAGRVAPIYPVFLLPSDLGGRAHRRVGLTAALAESGGAGGYQVTAGGESRFEQVMALVLLGDLVSVYLAALQGVDPTPAEAIDRIKRALGE